MAKLSAVSVAALAYMAGWKSASENVTAVAVARQESNFSTTAANSCCVGLWQINLKAHGVTKEDMVQPDKNALKAYQIYKGAGGWCTRGKPPNGCNPWQGYGARDWQTALNVGGKAYAELVRRMATGEKPEDVYGKELAGGIIGGMMDGPGMPSPLDTANAIAGSAKAMVDFMNRTGAWIGNSENWQRVLKVVAGVVVIVVGGALVSKDSPMMATAMKALPTGKATKLIKGGK